LVCIRTWTRHVTIGCNSHAAIRVTTIALIPLKDRVESLKYFNRLERNTRIVLQHSKTLDLCRTTDMLGEFDK
jgi:hypothetical protein